MHTGLKVLCAALGAAGCVAGQGALAAPVTYTAFAVSDVSLGGRMFQDALVYMTFVGDTADVTPFSVTAPDGAQASGWQITKGKAGVRIVANGRTVHATFLPNQIIVSYDFYNGGAGFGSFVGADHHLEPAYPLAMDGSSVFDAADIVTTSAWSGHAWSCIGFPPASGSGNGTCADPTAFPLQTDHGPFVIFQKYTSYDPPGVIWDNYSGALNTGFFSILVGP
jgi:hypothetical protein